MKLFVDSGSLADIETALGNGLIEGITTNPSLIAKEPKTGYITHLRQIVSLIRTSGRPVHLSVEPVAQASPEDPHDMVRQAESFAHDLAYEELIIQIPISRHGRSFTRAVREITSRGLVVNCTACMTPMQALAGAAAGARYVSLFYNRIRDGALDKRHKEHGVGLAAKVFEEADFDPAHVVSDTSRLLKISYPQTEIIACSIRTVLDIKHAGLAGAHIVSLPPRLFVPLLSHYQTDEIVDGFSSDIAGWLS